MLCWAHAFGCNWTDDCPASNSIVGHACNKEGTGPLGLCERHQLEILGASV